MTDAEIIDALGGCTQVALLLGFPKFPGAQRVGNWKKRGIPSEVKLNNLHLFHPKKLKVLAEKATA